jgi:hypothetical protein
MGFTSDIMHDFVAKEIRNIYSSYDGWTCSMKETGNGYDSVAVLERNNGGHRECVKILVSFDRSLPAHLPEDLEKPEKSMDGTIIRFSNAVMVPANADTSSLPETMKVYTMRSFSFEGKELIWVKKPVRKSEPEQKKVPA